VTLALIKVKNRVTDTHRHFFFILENPPGRHGKDFVICSEDLPFLRGTTRRCSAADRRSGRWENPSGMTRAIPEGELMD
jgi:hypothetical protein